ncbi:insulinase family protein [Spirosoma sp.]|uniref:insulinase family protein n=1 Tax=Spirosoma sp. TaxID=1899569 RepID=UPI003B3B1A3C
MRYLVSLTATLFLFSTCTLAQSDSIRLDVSTLKGSVVQSRFYQAEFGITYLTLSNGIKIALKPIAGEKDNTGDSAIYIKAESLNQKKQYTRIDNVSARIAGHLIRNTGVANLNREQLNQFLKKNNTHFEATGSSVSQGINMRTYNRHVEAALQLVYTFYTQPLLDSSALRRALDELIRIYQQPQSDVSLNHILSDSLRKVLYRDDYELTANDLLRVNPVHAFQLFKERFANNVDVTFTVVGTYSLDAMIPLLEKYIGSLPTTKRRYRQKEEDEGSFPNPRLQKVIYLSNLTEAVVDLVFIGKFRQVDADHTALINAYVNLLKKRLNRQVGRTALANEQFLVAKQSGGLLNGTRNRNRRTGVHIQIHCSPARISAVTDLVRTEMSRLFHQPIPEADLAEFKQITQKNNAIFLNNSYSWNLLLWSSSFRPDWPVKVYNSVAQRLEYINPGALQKIARCYARTKDIITLTFLPVPPNK